MLREGVNAAIRAVQVRPCQISPGREWPFDHFGTSLTTWEGLALQAANKTAHTLEPDNEVLHVREGVNVAIRAVQVRHVCVCV